MESWARTKGNIERMGSVKLRVTKNEYSNYIEKDTDIAIATEMAIKVLKTNPMIIGEPIAEVSPGCPMGYAKPKITLYYDIINPSIFDKIKMFITKTSLSQIIKENRVG